MADDEDLTRLTVRLPLKSQISGPPESFSENSRTRVVEDAPPTVLLQNMLAKFKANGTPDALLEGVTAAFLAAQAATTAATGERAAAADTGNENNRDGESKQEEETESTGKGERTEEEEDEVPDNEQKRKRKQDDGADDDNDEKGGGGAAEKKNKTKVAEDAAAAAAEDAAAAAATALNVDDVNEQAGVSKEEEEEEKEEAGVSVEEEEEEEQKTKRPLGSPKRKKKKHNHVNNNNEDDDEDMGTGNDDNDGTQSSEVDHGDKIDVFAGDGDDQDSTRNDDENDAPSDKELTQLKGIVLWCNERWVPVAELKEEDDLCHENDQMVVTFLIALGKFTTIITKNKTDSDTRHINILASDIITFFAICEDSLFNLKENDTASVKTNIREFCRILGWALSTTTYGEAGEKKASNFDKEKYSLRDLFSDHTREGTPEKVETIYIIPNVVDNTKDTYSAYERNYQLKSVLYGITPNEQTVVSFVTVGMNDDDMGDRKNDKNYVPLMKVYQRIEKEANGVNENRNSLALEGNKSSSGGGNEGGEEDGVNQEESVIRYVSKEGETIVERINVNVSLDEIDSIILNDDKLEVFLADESRKHKFYARLLAIRNVTLPEPLKSNITERVGILGRKFFERLRKARSNAKANVDANVDANDMELRGDNNDNDDDDDDDNDNNNDSNDNNNDNNNGNDNDNGTGTGTGTGRGTAKATATATAKGGGNAAAVSNKSLGKKKNVRHFDSESSKIGCNKKLKLGEPNNNNDMIADADADDDEEHKEEEEAVVEVSAEEEERKLAAEAESARQLAEEQERVRQQEAAEQLDKDEEQEQFALEEQEPTAEIPFVEYSAYGKVPELKDNIVDSSILERRSRELEEELILLEKEQGNAEKNQDQGMNSWSSHGRNDILLKSVASSFDYQKRVIYIQRSLGFGKKHVVSPLFVPQGLNGVYLCQFRYVVNDKKTWGYFEARAYILQVFYTFTVNENYLIQLEDVDVARLIQTPNVWTRSTGGSTSTQPTVSSIIDGVTTYENPFFHTDVTDVVPAHCVTSSIAGAMFEMGFPFQTEAMDFFHHQRDYLNQQTDDLWNKIVQKVRTTVTAIRLVKIVLPTHGGILPHQLLLMNDEWPIIVQIRTKYGNISHWISIGNGRIYDANSNIIMTKTIANLDLCAQLHAVGSTDSFMGTSKAYRYLPSIMKFDKNKKLFWNTVLPSREGFEFYEKRNCIKCQEDKLKEEYFIKQWSMANKKKGTCQVCLK